jgi:hypothetical protein
MDPVLRDDKVYPDTKILTQHLGKAINAWDSFINLLKTDYPLITTEWRYYNDGKSWLLKCTDKSKTIFWLSLYQKTFRVTFYFNRNYERVLEKSEISSGLKKEYKEGKAFGKIKPITIPVGSDKDIDEIRKLIAVKLSIK